MSYKPEVFVVAIQLDKKQSMNIVSVITDHRSSSRRDAMLEVNYSSDDGFIANLKKTIVQLSKAVSGSIYVVIHLKCMHEAEKLGEHFEHMIYSTNESGDDICELEGYTRFTYTSEDDEDPVQLWYYFNQIFFDGGNSIGSLSDGPYAEERIIPTSLYNEAEVVNDRSS